MSIRHSNLKRVAVLAAALVVWPTFGQTQDWATPDFCSVSIDDIQSLEMDPDFTAKISAVGDNIANGVGRLWEVKSPNGAVSHLWGTMHSSESVVLDLPPTMRRHLHDAELLALEIDFRYPDRATFNEAVKYAEWWQDFWLPPKPTPYLAGADPRIRDWVDNRVLATGVNPEYTAFLSPGGVMTVLLGDPCEDFVAGSIPVQDSLIKTLAYIDKTPIMGLEPATATIDALNHPEYEAYAEALITAYGAYLMPQADNQERVSAFALYRTGQIGTMMALDEAFLKQMLGPHAESGIALGKEFLLDDRNFAFVDNARTALDSGGLFMAVGAFHLPGEHGLVSILRNEGFTVTRLPVEGEYEQ